MNRREFLITTVAAAAPLPAQITGPQTPSVVVEGGQWSLGNEKISQVFASGAGGGLTLRSLRYVSSGFEWTAGGPTGVFLCLGSWTMSGGRDCMMGFGPDSGFRIVSNGSRKTESGAPELSLVLLSEARGLKVTLRDTC